jgi:Tfp pilus assembly protein PilF
MEAEEFYTLGMDALKQGNTVDALELLEKAVSETRNPRYCSCLGICLAKGKRDFKRAVSLCKEAIRNDPKNSLHFLNLGRVHLLAGQKKDAIRIFYMGLRHQNNQEITAELKKLGTRRPPVIPFLARENPLNKFLGKLLHKWGYR